MNTPGSIFWISGAVLATFAFAAYVSVVMTQWEETSRPGRAVNVSLLSVLAVVAYGSGENVSANTPPGIRAFALTVALIGLTFSLGYLLWWLHRPKN